MRAEIKTDVRADPINAGINAEIDSESGRAASAEDGRAFLALVGALGQPGSHREAARRLAAHLGAEDLVVFVRDAQVGMLLPAPGFAQTLPGAREWRAVLEACDRDGRAEGTLSSMEGQRVGALALRAGDGSVLVVLGGAPRPAPVRDLLMLVPLLAHGFRGETARTIAEAQAAMARHAADQAHLLAESLDDARQALQAALGEAKAASDAKDQFLAVLSHELRTPLTPVLTTVQMLEGDPNLSPELRDAVTLIRRNVQLETRLIDDLLDLTRVARGKIVLSPGPADLHDKLRHVARICDAEARARRIEVRLALEARAFWARVDAARLQQVFWNLLKNAIKFTPEGGTVTIRTWNEPDGASDGRFVAEVRDTGVGIPAAMLPKVFDAFEQGGRAVTRQFGGLGLGLAITKALVDLHGGTIEAASEGPGHGARFTVRLPTMAPPAKPAPAPAGMAPPAAPAAPAGGRILLVEDNQDTAAVMMRLLRLSGHTVRHADTLASALRTLEAESFDLILSDLGLPDGSGLDLMRQIRGRFAVRGIALSGFGMEEDVRRSLEAGFVAHLTKPVDIGTLRDALERLLAPKAMMGGAKGTARSGETKGVGGETGSVEK